MVDVVVVVVARQREARRARRDGGGNVHRPQHVRGRERAGCAGGARGRRDAGAVEQQHDRVRLRVLADDGAGVGQPAFDAADDERVRDARRQARLQPIAQRAHARRVAAQPRRRDFGGLAQADDRRSILGAAAPAAFLACRPGSAAGTARRVGRRARRRPWGRAACGAESESMSIAVSRKAMGRRPTA